MIMITPEMKDRIIKSIIDSPNGTDDRKDVHPKVEAPCFNLSQDAYRMFLKQLHRMNLLKYEEQNAGRVLLWLNMELYDFHARGGFVVQEELFLKNIEKLLAEIDKLKSEFPEKVDLLANISSIGSFIMQGLFFLK